MKLTKKQTIALDFLEDNITKEIIFGGGAGGAKSVLGCYWLGKMCLKYPGTRWVMGRAVLKTLKETTLNSFMWVMGQQGLRATVNYRYNAQSNAIYFPGGSEILLKDLYTYPSDPNFDELGSLEITGAFVDECNQIDKKAWNILKSRIRYRLDEYGLSPKILGTCNPSKNWVYSDFFRPNQSGELNEGKVFIQALLTDNPFISSHYKENLLSLDTASKERLLYGNWSYDDDPSALIEYDAILDLYRNEHVQRTGKRYITFDVARFGRDSTVIMVWDGMVVIHCVELKKSDITEVAAKVRELANRFGVPMSRTIGDEDGLGGGAIDILKCKGFVNNSRPIKTDSAKKLDTNIENYANLKSQCYYKLSERLNAREMHFAATVDTSVTERLTADLEQVKQANMNSDGKKAVLPKEKVKELLGRSPDFSDCLMMREYFELKPAKAWVVL